MSPSYPSQYDYDISWNSNQVYGGMEQQVPFSNYANSSQGFIQENNPQAYTPQYQWCSYCGGDHFEESCYLFNPTNHDPQNFFPQEPQYQDFSQNQAPPPLTLEAIANKILKSQQQCRERHRQWLQEMEEIDKQWEQEKAHQQVLTTQEPPCYEFQAPPPPNLENTLEITTESHIQPYEKLRHAREKVHQLSTQNETLAKELANEALREWFFSDEWNEVEDEDEKDHDKCIETEILSGECEMDIQANGDQEQLEDEKLKDVLSKDVVQDSPLPSENLEVEEKEDNDLEDEELEEHHVIKDSKIRKDYMPETHVELQENNGDEQLEDSQLDKVLNEITQNPIGVEEEDWRVVWKRCFEEENYQKENLEEESIFLDIEPQILPVWSMQSLSLKEFLDARHLRIYLDRKVDGEKGLVSTQSIEECDSRGCVELIDVKLSASWEAPHVILYFHAF